LTKLTAKSLFISKNP